MYSGKYSLLNGVTSWRSCSGVPRDCVDRICLWPLRRDDHSGVLIGSGGTRRSYWPARVLANDISTRIERWPSREERSIARVQGQVAASHYKASQLDGKTKNWTMKRLHCGAGTSQPAHKFKMADRRMNLQ